MCDGLAAGEHPLSFPPLCSLALGLPRNTKSSSSFALVEPILPSTSFVLVGRLTRSSASLVLMPIPSLNCPSSPSPSRASIKTSSTSFSTTYSGFNAAVVAFALNRTSSTCWVFRETCQTPGRDIQWVTGPERHVSRFRRPTVTSIFTT